MFLKVFCLNWSVEFVKLLIEKYSPFFVALVTAVFLILNKIDIASFKNITDMLSSITNIASVLVGFIATILSILIALPTHKVIQRIMMNDSIKHLRMYFASSIALGLVTMLFTLFLYPFVDVTVNDIQLPSWVFSIWLSIFIYFILSCVRVIWILLLLLNTESILNNEQNQPEVIDANPSNIFQND
jgi:hypothetical protein